MTTNSTPMIDRLPERNAEVARAIHDRIREAETLLELLMTAIEREYAREQNSIVGSPEQGRLALVHRLLGGEPVSTSELATLGYAFDAWHVGVITTGDGARDVIAGLNTSRQFLSMCHDNETVWGWLGGRQKPSHAEIERICSRGVAAGLTLAIGEPGLGIDGWRRTHHQARRAQDVVLLAPQPCIRYADVALLSPWLQEPTEARILIEVYLSPLDDQRDGGASSRRALRAYFGAARNVSAAARKLGLDRRTLAYRLRAIEERLGYRLDEHAAELEVALRLREVLDHSETPKSEKIRLADFHIGVAPL